MTNSPGWYDDQAAIFFGRGEECLRVRDELDGSPLIAVLDHAGDDTWQCPAAAEFRADVLIEQGNVLDAMDALWTNATGLGNQGDNMARTAANLREQLREAARQQQQAQSAGVPM